MRDTGQWLKSTAAILLAGLIGSLLLGSIVNVNFDALCFLLPVE